MNFKRLMNETLVANSGDMSRGLKNQLTIVSAFADTELDAKLDYLKQKGISIYTYAGLRIIEFRLSDIQTVVNNNGPKLDTYRANPQELVKDLRKNEIANSKMNFAGIGGISE